MPSIRHAADRGRTPCPEHAGNCLSQEPKLPSPMIEVEKVASAILDAATDNVKVGAMSVLNTTTARLMPSIGQAMARMQIGRQQRNEPPHARKGALYEAGESGRGNENTADSDATTQSNVRKEA